MNAVCVLGVGQNHCYCPKHCSSSRIVSCLPQGDTHLGMRAALLLDDLLSCGTPNKAVWKTYPTQEHSCRDTPPRAASSAEHRCCGEETAPGCGRHWYMEEAAILRASGWVLAARSAASARLLAGTGLLSRGQICRVGEAAQEPVGRALAGICGARADVQLCGDAQTLQSQQHLRAAVPFLMVPPRWGGHGKG